MIQVEISMITCMVGKLTIKNLKPQWMQWLQLSMNHIPHRLIIA